MKVGLVLSGGFLKGAYQIGALRALSESPLSREISCVSAASIGAINAYAYMTDKLDLAERMWRSVKYGPRCSVRSIVRSGYFESALSELYSSEDVIRCSFSFPLVDLAEKRLVYWAFSNHQRNAVDYLRASVALPFCGAPVRIDGKDYCDGGLVDNIPINPLLNEKNDITICMYFDKYNYIFDVSEQDSEILKITFADDSIIRNSLCYEPSRVEKMISDGYRRMSEALRTVAGGTVDPEIMKSRISVWNGENTKIHQPKVNGDVIISNFNRLLSLISGFGNH